MVSAFLAEKIAGKKIFSEASSDACSETPVTLSQLVNTIERLRGGGDTRRPLHSFRPRPPPASLGRRDGLRFGFAVC